VRHRPYPIAATPPRHAEALPRVRERTTVTIEFLAGSADACPHLVAIRIFTEAQPNPPRGFANRG